MEFNKIYNKDCVAFMKQLPSKCIDCIITDPPYVLKNGGHGGTGDFAERKLVKDKHIDFISNGFDNETVFNEFIRLCKIPNFYIFCSNRQVSQIMSWFEGKNLSTTLLVWHKLNPIPLVRNKHLPDVEFVVYVRGGGATFNDNVPIKLKSHVYTSPVVDNRNRFHPTQKDVNQIRQFLLLSTKANDVVLDPFIGGVLPQ